MGDVYPCEPVGRAQELLEELLAGYEPVITQPRHGPGAVAGGERFHQKWEWSHLHASVHQEFPYYDYLYGLRGSGTFDAEGPLFRNSPTPRPFALAAKVREYRALRRVPYPVSRLLFVPKDSRGPRTIACEPKELMFLQQGVSAGLVRWIEQHPLTKGHVNFTDQTINGRLCLKLQSNRHTPATIDLSDASDRVSVALVLLLFPKEIGKKLLALRSHAVTCQTHHWSGSIFLKKYAPMGSALCFPVEALVFWSLAVAALEQVRGARRKSIHSVWVYGDDIVIDGTVTEVRRVMDVLESVGLVVNRSKSFMGSNPFRESCGVEAFAGRVITPQRIKKLPPSSPTDGPGIASYLAYASDAEAKGMPHRARACYQLASEAYGYWLPISCEKESFLSMVSDGLIHVPSWMCEGSWSGANLRLRHGYASVRHDPSLNVLTGVYPAVRPVKARKWFDPWARLLLDVTTPSDEDPTVVVARQATQITVRRRKIASRWMPITP